MLAPWLDHGRLAEQGRAGGHGDRAAVRVADLSTGHDNTAAGMDNLTDSPGRAAIAGQWTKQVDLQLDRADWKLGGARWIGALLEKPTPTFGTPRMLRSTEWLSFLSS